MTKTEIIMGQEPTEVYTDDPRFSERVTIDYYLDIHEKVINKGDELEIKWLVGGYGRTRVTTGVITELGSLGSFFLWNGIEKTIVSINREYDFDLSTKFGSKHIRVFRTSAEHGFGAMDVHAHTTYVKILKKGTK